MKETLTGKPHDTLVYNTVSPHGVAVDTAWWLIIARGIP